MTTKNTKSTVRAGIRMEKIVAVLSAFKDELAIEYKKNWVKVEGKLGACVYIQLAEVVRQIDLSGFGAGLDGTHPVTQPNGGVQAHLTLDDENAALSRLEEIFMTLNVQERAVRTRSKKLSQDSRSAALKALAALEVKAPVAIEIDASEEGAYECQGHPASLSGPGGVTEYCDGSCRPSPRSPGETAHLRASQA
jgi:hypothetical protein